ncbi:MAG TPA: amino acid permease, partial [Thermoanaerobaculia bacterium]|nr:amino acid permease [Thermoanaerobaculia bacterium]
GFSPPTSSGGLKPAAPLGLIAAMTPVMFAYGGWQTASFMSGELKRPRRDLAIGLIAGVIGVVTVYLSVNYICLRVLGADGLAATTTPASAVMRAVMGERGATLIAAGIAISTLGFLSQGMLTAPRVYYAMAEDRMFFAAVGRLHPRTRVPVLAIVLQGVVAIIIALSGTYEQILSYVVAVDFIFFGLTGLALFVFRRRIAESAGFRTPLHPLTTGLFVLACWAIVVGTFVKSPVNSFIGVGIMLAGLPAWWLWSSADRRR